jgi:HSP20 family protein
MLLSLTDPFDVLIRLQRDLDSRLASGWLEAGTTGVGAYPPINVFQHGHDFVAVIEMPGVTKENLEVHAKDGTIRLSGKKAIDYGDKVSLHRRERIAGTFDRTITLPVRIDPDGIKAEMRDGLLALFIPRAESDKPRTIAIN